MFFQGHSLLSNRLRMDALTLPQSAQSGNVQPCPAETMRLSERLHNPKRWQCLQRARRDTLESLLTRSPEPENVQTAIDALCMIFEESTWASIPSDAPFDDENHPQIDLTCAETAVLLGWIKSTMGKALDAISPRIVGRMLSEVRRRIFTPLLAHEDYPFMLGKGACPIAICADISLAALLLETDPSRLSRLLKTSLRLLDEVCGRHGRTPAPLSERIADIAAATDFASLLRALTDEAFDLSGRIPMNEWLDEILFSWIEKDWFIDPAGDGLSPALSGGDVFRIGLAADDSALTALGAQIFRQNHLPSRTVTGRLLETSVLSALESEEGRPPRMRYAATHRNQLMTARLSGLYFAMHTGGRRGNAGDLVLFADGKPILTDGGNAHSLPLLNGCEPLTVPEIPCAADFEVGEERETLGIELTGAYPSACALRSYQRSALVLRGEQSLRLVDMLSFSDPSPVAFRFVAAVAPEIHAEEIRLGPVRMLWEGDLICSVLPLKNGLFLLQFSAVQPVSQALFAFRFEHL